MARNITRGTSTRSADPYDRLRTQWQRATINQLALSEGLRLTEASITSLLGQASDTQVTSAGRAPSLELGVSPALANDLQSWREISSSSQASIELGGSLASALVSGATHFRHLDDNINAVNRLVRQLAAYPSNAAASVQSGRAPAQKGKAVRANEGDRQIMTAWGGN